MGVEQQWARPRDKTRSPLPDPNNRGTPLHCQARAESAGYGPSEAVARPAERSLSAAGRSPQCGERLRPGLSRPRLEKAGRIWYHYRRGELAEWLKAAAC